MKRIDRFYLVANAGSSSLKLDVYDNTQNKILHINCDYDDSQKCHVSVTDVVDDKTEEVSVVLDQVMNVVKDLL